MKERGQRLVLLLFSLTLLIVLKSHGKVPPESTVAFVRYTGSRAMFQIKGDTAHAGIYKFCDGAAVINAINMTVPAVVEECPDLRNHNCKLFNGAVVHASARNGQPSEISIGRMKSSERILLGIPLHPDEMDYRDWECLPGIGPGLARIIMNDRQKNGGFGDVMALLRVPGLGKGKVERLIRYF